MTDHSGGGSLFKSQKFTDWPTVKEALIAKEIGAVFILAPMAMQLVHDGVPVKVCYLGHRDGTAIMVGKDSDIPDFGEGAINPTAENMAIHLLEDNCPTLLDGTGVRASKVVIWETEQAFAEAAL